jgi:hypothetical protein
MGLTLQGLLLDRDRCPSRGPCLLDVTRCHTPPRGEARTTWPPSRPCSRDEFVLSPGPQVIPAVDSFLGFDLPELALVRPGTRFDRGASPLALRRLDVQARPGLRVLRCERVERSVSGPPALLGFCTFRRHRHSVRRSAGRAYRFASRGNAPKRISAIHAPPSRRSSRSRAYCPVSAPIGLRLVTSSVRQRLFFKEPRLPCDATGQEQGAGQRSPPSKKNVVVTNPRSNGHLRMPFVPIGRDDSTKCENEQWEAGTPTRVWTGRGQRTEGLAAQGLAAWERLGHLLGPPIPAGSPR